MAWIDTYRGTVHRWEVDNVDHFTVAFYFERFEDATAALLHTLGLDHASLAVTKRACVTLTCHVRYLRELRMGDILHIRSGVINAEAESLLLGHQVIDSGDGALCTTVAQRIALVEMDSRTPVGLTQAQRDAAASLQVDWAAQGAEVRVTRQILDTSGNQISKDVFYSNYQPWGAIIQVAPGDSRLG